ncbi:MAG: CoA transferase [Actinobacteria bacterium]|nr:CoA transferase [Actinomycetota bacterium]
MSALAGLRVIDAATLFAGPTAATMLADFGADVIKIEHPTKGDPVRGHGYSKDGQSLWWANIGRNKSTLALNLGSAEGAQVFLNLIEQSDVLIENFRPGTLERWGIGPEQLHERNPKLIIARVTGFGQFGPYAHRAGFGTLAESMSGFATMTGEADGPPTLPPFALADGISALAISQAIMFALFAQNNPDSEGFGKGQVIDLAIIEPILAILGPHATVYDQLGVIPQRTGNRSVNNSPRNTYLTKDNKWLAVSTSAQSIAERVMILVGHPEVINEPWFSEGSTRAQHAELLDQYVGDWIAHRDAHDVVAQFEKAEAAVAPIYNIADVMNDPQFQALETIISIDDLVLGPVKMQNVLYRMDQTPGEVQWSGRTIGADTRTILTTRLGMSDEAVDSLLAKGVIGTSENK